MRITERAKRMEIDAAHDARRKKEADQRRQSEIDDLVLITTAGTATGIALGVTVYFVLEALQQ